MNACFKSDQGLIRSSNEDSVHVDTELGLFIVADGMGGHNAGEIASGMAVERIAEIVSEEISVGTDTPKLLKDAITAANRSIIHTAASDPWWNQMGTTVVVALFRDQNVTIAHVGDSRAYIMNSHSITQLTEDHTFVAEWVKDGSITSEQARTHVARHGLTMAMGLEEGVEPSIEELRWTANETLLLCSDGLTEVLEDSEILAIISAATDLQQGCEALINAANIKGGPDNISVVLVRA